MEGGCLSLTTAISSAPLRPTSFPIHGGVVLKRFHRNHDQLVPASASYSAFNRSRRKPSSVKASKQSFSTRRQALPSNWDISNNSAVSLPKLEELNITDTLLRQRIIFVTTVDDASADFIISQLLYLDAEDPKKDIRLFIHSLGGSITAAMAIYDGMKLCKADISTLCLGIAGSLGAFLLAAGTKGKRFCMPNARVMLHLPPGFVGGDLTARAVQIREMSYQTGKLIKMYSRMTGQIERQISDDTRMETFMSAWEAKEYGLVDAVVDDGKPGLVAPLVQSSMLEMRS